MPIKSAAINAIDAQFAAEAAKIDVAKQPIIDDIRDYVELAATRGIAIGTKGVGGALYVPGVYVGAGIIINGRPATLGSMSTLLTNEATADLLSMRQALADAINVALATLKQQKGS